MADALSRVPFCEGVGHRLVSEPLHELAREAAVMSGTAVQQTFRESTNQPVMAEKLTCPFTRQLSLCPHRKSLLLSSHTLNGPLVQGLMRQPL